MYHKGQGVDQDFHAAVQWFQSAAAQGAVNAQVNLGVMYANGDGISQDFKEAMKWFRLAAVQGDTLAQFSLGLMYERADGVPQDFVRGHMWFIVAAAQGNAAASKSRDDLSKVMTKEQITEAQAMARKCEASNYKQCD
jgi:TPR repeat protein